MSTRSSAGTGGWRSVVRRGSRGSAALTRTADAATTSAAASPSAGTTPPTSRGAASMSSSSSFRVVESFRVTPRVTLLLARGSVLDFVPRPAVDVGGYGSGGIGTNRSSKFVPSAIVNAANPGCLGGGGVDGAITDAGGPTLAKDRLKLPVVRSAEGMVRCPTGSAVRTGPNLYGDLRTPYVIHAVGPNYNDYCSYSYGDFEYGYTEDNEDPFRQREQEQGWGFGDDGSRWEPGHKLLQSAYQTSLDLALEVNCHQVAFSLLSAGVYRGPVPLHQIFELTAKSIQEWAFRRLDDDPSSSSIPANGITMSANDEEYNDSSQPMEVILCAYSPSECQTLVEACRRVLAT